MKPRVGADDGCSSMWADGGKFFDLSDLRIECLLGS